MILLRRYNQKYHVELFCSYSIWIHENEVNTRYSDSFSLFGNKQQSRNDITRMHSFNRMNIILE